MDSGITTDLQACNSARQGCTRAPGSLGALLSEPGFHEKETRLHWNHWKELTSSDQNVKKFVFEKPDAVAEAVLYKYPTYEDRTVICCSTQSGCPVGCRFCGAGDAFVRSLTADEIISQPLTLLESTSVDPLDIKRLQIMFMSMGEPLLNMRALITAIDQLNVLYPHAALLVSTSGPNVNYAPFMAVAKRISQVGLQFSVHESTNEARDRLIPFKAKLSLEQIAATGNWFSRETGRPPFFNYCVHEKNNTPEDAKRLHGLFDPMIWQATISVVCERDESVSAAHQRQRELADGFRDELMRRGFQTRVFDPAGQDDIGGGCGQLWFVQKWFRDHENKVMPSIGRGLPVIHAPN